MPHNTVAMVKPARQTSVTLRQPNLALSQPDIGVMIAVALMPPLVTVGMLAADGDLSGAVGAGMLVAANVVCVNLAGVATFLIRGVRPRAWWEAAESARRSRHALTVWVALLLALAVWIGLHELGWL